VGRGEKNRRGVPTKKDGIGGTKGGGREARQGAKQGWGGKNLQESKRSSQRRKSFVVNKRGREKGEGQNQVGKKTKGDKKGGELFQGTNKDGTIGVKTMRHPPAAHV